MPSTICFNCGQPINIDEVERLEAISTAEREEDARKTKAGCGIGCLIIFIIVIFFTLVVSFIPSETPEETYKAGVEAAARRSIERDKENAAKLRRQIDIEIEKQRIKRQEGSR